MAGIAPADESIMVSITIGPNTYTGALAKDAGAGVQEPQEPEQGEPQEAEAVAAQGQEGGRRKMKGMKKTKSKAKGTRKLSPYMKFAQQARKEVLQENPNLKSDVIAVGRKIGEKWRALSDAEKAKY
jgi:hypothetical protein